MALRSRSIVWRARKQIFLLGVPSMFTKDVLKKMDTPPPRGDLVPSRQHTKTDEAGPHRRERKRVRGGGKGCPWEAFAAPREKTGVLGIIETATGGGMKRLFGGRAGMARRKRVVEAVERETATRRAVETADGAEREK